MLLQRRHRSRQSAVMLHCKASISRFTPHVSSSERSATSNLRIWWKHVLQFPYCMAFPSPASKRALYWKIWNPHTSSRRLLKQLATNIARHLLGCLRMIIQIDFLGSTSLRPLHLCMVFQFDFVGPAFLGRIQHWDLASPRNCISIRLAWLLPCHLDENTFEAPDTLWNCKKTYHKDSVVIPQRNPLTIDNQKNEKTI